MKRTRIKPAADKNPAARELKKIETDIFRKYGYLIDWNNHKQKGSGNQFRIVTRERVAQGWRIAYLIVKDRAIDRLEQHPNSMESFEPIRGKAVLHVCNQKKPSRVESFILDKPVILRKGVWHGVTSISDETHIKITENHRVGMKKHRLGYTL